MIQTRINRQQIFLMARYTLSFLVVVGFIAIFIKALKQFSISWDFIVYHLPFAMMHYDMTSFKPLESLMPVYDAFPPLAHLVQGGLIKMTGSFTSPNLVSFVGLIVVVSIIKVCRLTLNQSVFWGLCLSVPMFAIHLSDGYIDLFTGSMVCSNFIALAAFRNSSSVKNGLLFIFTMALAMWSKYQAWPFMAINLCVFSANVLFCRGLSRNKTILLILLGAVSFSNWPVRNFVKFGNPTHPIRPPVIAKYLNIEQGTKAEENKVQQPRELLEKSYAYRLFYSIFELSRLSYSGFYYSLDQGFPDTTSNHHFRLGGWSGAYSVFLLLSLLIIAILNSKMRVEIAIFSSYFFLLCFIPQSHELRYWLFMPMIGAFLIASAFNKNVLVSLVTIFLLVFNSLQITNAFETRTISVEKRTPSSAISYVKDRIKMGNTNMQECVNMLPFTIFWSGEDFNQVAVQDCSL